MPRHYKVASYIAMPIAVLIWVIGWGIYLVGSKKEIKQKTILVIHQN